MELKAGYKQTDLGPVPSDWKILTVGELAATSSGTTPARTMWDRYFRNGHIPWVKTLDLNNSEIRSTDEQVTTAAVSETSLRLYPAGSVLVAMYGGYKQIGRTGLLTIPATVNQALTAIRPDPRKLTAGYLLRVLNYRVDYWKSIASSSRKDPNITGRDIARFPLAVPAIPEQEAIAETLSDADALIESLEQLLAKKRQIKQGAMQELLTGKKRLPGFSGEWEVTRLGQISTSSSGGTPPTSVAAYYDGEIPWVSISDMTKGGKTVQKTDRNLTRAGLASCAAQMFPAGTVLYALYASIGECSIAGIPLCSSQAILGIRPNDALSGDFLYYFLTSLKPVVKAMGQQGTQANLNAGIVRDFELRLPSFGEQSAIASTLSDMDADIAALEAKLAKVRSIKQGMMQELLTGRIRLV